MKMIIEKTLGEADTEFADRANAFCPVFVVATRGQNSNGPVKKFRSYGPYWDKCRIWEAARATTAAPTYFPPILISPPYCDDAGGYYIDGGIRHNNPSALALEEACEHWPNIKKICIVSIGTGKQNSVSVITESMQEETAINPSQIKDRSSAASKLSGLVGKLGQVRRIGPSLVTLKSFAKALVDISTNTEEVHDNMVTRSRSRNPDQRFPYHRFNVDTGMDRIGMQEGDRLSEISELTDGYLDRVETKLGMKKCIDDLVNPCAVECINS
jgi:patatin-like phospholipase/acyl hydrolase